MAIKRHPGTAIGRSRCVEHGGMVYTVAVADDLSADVRTQAEQTLARLDRNLADAGADRSRLLSVTVYLADLADKPVLNEVWNRWIGPEDWPQRACVGVELDGGTLVEIVALAAK